MEGVNFIEFQLCVNIVETSWNRNLRKEYQFENVNRPEQSVVKRQEGWKGHEIVGGGGRMGERTRRNVIAIEEYSDF